MQYYNNVLETIGNTPLIKLNKVNDGLKPLILAKVESFNPGSSVKDRIGIAMIDEAEKKGLLKPGGTVVEGTSGNTGVGLAMVCAIRGYRAIFTMPDKMSMEKIRLLRAYGAEVIITPTAVPPDHPESYYTVAKKIQRETSNCLYPDQYNNQENPMAHYRTTGPEIWKQTDGKIDVFVCGVGTAGTISGVGKYLKEKNPAVKVIGVDPEGSILKDYKDSGGKIIGKTFRTYKVEGIGEDLIPKTLWVDYIDEVVRSNDTEAFSYARRLAREEGMVMGGSAGSAIAGCMKYVQSKNLGADKVVVVLLPDSGERYLSKFYNDDWMRENGFLTDQPNLLQILERKKGPREILSVKPHEKVKKAIDMMNKSGISQLPVIDDQGVSVGLVTETELMTAALEKRVVLESDVDKIMQGSLPILDGTLDIGHALALLKQHPAVLVKRGTKLEGILTKYDFVEEFARR